MDANDELGKAIGDAMELGEHAAERERALGRMESLLNIMELVEQALLSAEGGKHRLSAKSEGHLVRIRYAVAHALKSPPFPEYE